MATYNHTMQGGVTTGYRYNVGGDQRKETNAEVYHVQHDPDIRFATDETFGTVVRNGTRVNALRPNGHWTSSGSAAWINQDGSTDLTGHWQSIDENVDDPEIETWIQLTGQGAEIGSGVYGDGFLCTLPPITSFPNRVTLRIHYEMASGSKYIWNPFISYEVTVSGNPGYLAFSNTDFVVTSNSRHTQDIELPVTNGWVDTDDVLNKPLFLGFNTHTDAGEYTNDPAVGLKIYALEVLVEGESSYARGEVTNLRESAGFAVSTWYRTWRPTSPHQVLVNRQVGLGDGWELAHDYFYTDSQWDSVLSFRFWDRDEQSLIGTGGNSGELRITPVTDWTHVVAQYRPDAATNGNVDIFVNGVLRTTYEAFSAPHDSDARLLLGASDGMAGNALHGDLKDVRIYDHPLTEGEVCQMFRHGCELYAMPSFFVLRSFDPTQPIVASGGVVTGGSAAIYVATGNRAGLEVGGTAVPTGGVTLSVGGGVQIGGAAQSGTDWQITPSGGLVLGEYPYRYAKTITVPAGTVSQDFSAFYLGVIFQLDPTKVGDADFVFTNSALTHLPFELREYDASTGRLTAYVRTPLSAAQDTLLYVLYGAT